MGNSIIILSSLTTLNSLRGISNLRYLRSLLFNKFNKMEGTNYHSFNNSIKQFESNKHYSNLMCFNDTKNGPKENNTENNHYLSNVKILEGRDNLKKKCVLPKGHTGKCCANLNCLFKEKENNKKVINKLISSIELAIFQTPGNDDYVYKNRSQRLFHTVLDSIEEKKIRDKNIKKKMCNPFERCIYSYIIGTSLFRLDDLYCEC